MTNLVLSHHPVEEGRPAAESVATPSPATEGLGRAEGGYRRGRVSSREERSAGHHRGSRPEDRWADSGRNVLLVVAGAVLLCNELCAVSWYETHVFTGGQMSNGRRRGRGRRVAISQHSGKIRRLWSHTKRWLGIS